MSWETKKSHYKVLNMEHAGQDIEIGFNGKIYQIQHGATVLIPDAVAEALNDCKKIEYKVQGEMGRERTMIAIEVPRFMTVKTSPEIEGDTVAESVMKAKFQKRKNEADEQ